MPTAPWRPSSARTAEPWRAAPTARARPRTTGSAAARRRRAVPSVRAAWRSPPRAPPRRARTPRGPPPVVRNTRFASEARSRAARHRERIARHASLTCEMHASRVDSRQTEMSCMTKCRSRSRRPASIASPLRGAPSGTSGVESVMSAVRSAPNTLGMKRRIGVYHAFSVATTLTSRLPAPRPCKSWPPLPMPPLRTPSSTPRLSFASLALSAALRPPADTKPLDMSSPFTYVSSCKGGSALRARRANARVVNSMASAREVRIRDG